MNTAIIITQNSFDLGFIDRAAIAQSTAHKYKLAITRAIRAGVRFTEPETVFTYIRTIPASSAAIVIDRVPSGRTIGSVAEMKRCGRMSGMRKKM